MIIYYCSRELTIAEALEIIEDDDLDLSAIYIEPPQVTENSDEDSGEEDTGGVIDNLTGNQLRSKAEVVLWRENQVVFNQDEDSDVSEEVEEHIVERKKSNETLILKKRKRSKSKNEDEMRPSTSRTKQKESITKKKTIKLVRKPSSWVHDENPPSNIGIFPEADYTSYRGKSPTELFDLFVGTDIIDFLVTETQRYALFLNVQEPQIKAEEIKSFIGILLLSGYNVVPSRRCYWENALDTRNELVYNSMRRDRFEKIMRFIHCADNTNLDRQDKMCKLRPLINLMKERFMKNYIPEQCMNYDECMIPYFGRHPCKQFIRGKPIRFGFKAWCLNTSSGYLISFEIYQGNRVSANDEYESHYGKCAAPLVEMLDNLPHDTKSLPFRLYFDNLFTGFNLINHLKQRGYGATGTIRENRVPKDCGLTNSKTMKKMKRGSFEVLKSVEENISVIRWVDNSVVTVASSCHSVQPIGNVQRYSCTEKKKIAVPRPSVIGEYNCFMGGTDRMDESVSLYRIGIRGKKWWWSIFSWFLDTAVHNAWILHRKSGGQMRLLAFRRSITQTILIRQRNPPKGPGRTPSSAGNVTDSR